MCGVFYMYYISYDKDKIQLSEVVNLLGKTYWAKERSEETIQTSINNSICYGAYSVGSGRQIAFARVITDFATTYYICDVVVDEAHRGWGIGKALVSEIVKDERFKNLGGILLTLDANGLYEKYGFSKASNICMIKKPE